ncbi:MULTISPECIES: hypothetical protein [unclassified Mycobacterium]|uniref:hypothetical protein n=1 Tax=unclassified Mycobacterium TaxID=2642494 RepID=UPI0025706760|nr:MULTISPECIES: hypothetical protein [unclassified Mycobacterium]
MTDTGELRRSAGRGAGPVETVVSWLLWVLVSIAGCIAAFATIFPVGFGGAFPEQADEAGKVFVWSLLTVLMCMVAPVAMGIGHWRHWHIWYWPALCVAALARTLFLLQSL